MANYLKMTEASAILRLKEHGWSQRRIARELGIHPDTVGRYVHLSGRDSKPVKAPTGSGEVNACNSLQFHATIPQQHYLIHWSKKPGVL